MKWHTIGTSSTLKVKRGSLGGRNRITLYVANISLLTPHVDTGDYIVVINAEIAVTGKKRKTKKYYRHTGYPGGIRETNFTKLIAQTRWRANKAVKGMLPKGSVGYAMIKKLKVYSGTEHPHTAQQPQVLDI